LPNDVDRPKRQAEPWSSARSRLGALSGVSASGGTIAISCSGLIAASFGSLAPPSWASPGLATIPLPPDPTTSNTRTNRSPNYGRQPIPVGVRSHQLERTISTRNCSETTLATRRIDGPTDPSPPRKPHRDNAAAGPPDEYKSRRHLSNEWQVPCR
jgi:hypothetical protein